MSAATSNRIREALSGLSFHEVASRDGLPAIETEVGEVHDVLMGLRDRAGFETNTFVTAIDHLHSAAEKRFEVCWQLLSLQHQDRIRIHVHVSEEQASVPTCTDLWPGASFSERECWDMFGIRFEGHADLRRLLMPEEYGHHPLRKDFPHEGIEPDRLYREWDEQRRKQEARAKDEA